MTPIVRALVSLPHLRNMSVSHLRLPRRNFPRGIQFAAFQLTNRRFSHTGRIRVRVGTIHVTAVVAPLLIDGQVTFCIRWHFRHRLLLDAGEIGEDAGHHVRRGVRCVRSHRLVFDVRIGDHGDRFHYDRGSLRVQNGEDTRGGAQRSAGQIQGAAEVVLAVGHLQQTMGREADFIHCVFNRGRNTN